MHQVLSKSMKVLYKYLLAPWGWLLVENGVRSRSLDLVMMCELAGFVKFPLEERSWVYALLVLILNS